MNMTQMIKASRNLVKYSALGLAAAAMLGVGTSANAAPPVSGYTRWFDASTLGLADNDPVSTWPDGSVNAADATVPSGNATPVYVANAGTETGLGAIYFAKNDGADSSAALRFTRDTAIRTVFSVFKGNAFLLTDTDTYNFHRPGDDNPSDSLIANYDAGPIVAGKTYVNKVLVDPENDPMPTDVHNGFNLVEILTDGNPVNADSFNKDRTYHAGNQYQAEVIIYDRVLTEEERLAVEEYLFFKWFNPGPPAAPTGLVATPWHHSIHLTWDATVGASGYKVDRLTGTGGTIDATYDASGTSYTDTSATVNSGGPYYYVVRAVNGAGSGDPSAEASASPSADPVAQTITFRALASKTFGDSPFDLTATASSDLTVSYASSDEGVATVSGSTVTILKAGTTTITATQAGNDDFTAAPPVEQTLTVVMADQAITFTLGSALVKQVNVAPFVDTATGGASGNPVTYTSSDEGVATVDASGLVTIKGLGVTQIRANQLGLDEYYNAAPEVSQSLTIIPPLALPVTEGVVCWYDAGNGVTADGGGNVSDWNDLSGLGHHGTGGGGSKVLAAGEIKGKPAVQFRSSGFLNCSGTMFTKEQYVVARSPHTDSWGGYGAFLGRASGRNSSYLLTPENTTMWNDHAAEAVSRNGTRLVKNQHDNGNYVFNLAPINEYMLLKITVENNDTSAADYQIGRADGMQCDMDIAEIIGYDHALSSADENLLGAYFTSKYGLTGTVNPIVLDVSASGTGAEILNDGKFIEANHFGSSPVNPVVLANGLTFGISTDRLIRPTGPNFQAEWEYNGSQTYQTGWAHNSSDNRVGDNGWGITDLGFYDLMSSVWWVNYSGSRSDMEITGLTVGNTYRLQLISENSQDGTVSVEGNPPVAWFGGSPSVFTVTWVATDDTLNMQYSRKVNDRSSGSGQGGEVFINGYVLHDVTKYPPGTVLIIW